MSTRELFNEPWSLAEGDTGEPLLAAVADRDKSEEPKPARADAVADAEQGELREERDGAREQRDDLIELVDHLKGELADERAKAELLAGALALALYDGHPVYANTTGSRGGIGGQAMTQCCSLIAPPAGADWMESGLDLLSSPLRDYIRERPEFDLDTAKSAVEAAARAALAGPEPEATVRPAGSVTCPDKGPHEPHWHVVQAAGITYAQGQCAGVAPEATEP